MSETKDEKVAGNQHKKTTIDKPKPIKSDNFRLDYANNVQVRGTFFDIRVIVGEFLHNDNDEIVFREDITVVFSPQHAKAFSKLLENQISDYEKKYGDIPILKESMSEIRDVKTQQPVS